MDPNWKVEDHEMDRWNYLAGKMDALQEDINSEKITPEEMVEFCQIWYREKFKPDDSFILKATREVNQGDCDIFFK